jgi:hypothetical protein
MVQLLRRKHALERPDGTGDVTNTPAEKLEQPTSEATAKADDVKLVVGPPGCCCCTSELPVRKQPRRA